MTIKMPKVWRVLRWILFMPLAVSAFFLIVIFAGRLLESNGLTAILTGALATAAAIRLSKAVAPSPRLAIAIVAPTILLALIFYIEEYGANESLLFLGYPIGLVLGFFISTKKGSERSGVLRALRWAMFLPVTAVASVFTLGIVMEFAPILRFAGLNREHFAVAIGNAIFVGVAALLVPSHRPAVILLTAPLTYLIVSAGPIKESPSLASGLFFFMAWALGGAAGGLAVLKMPSAFKKPLRAETDTGDKKRRYKGTAPYQDHRIDRDTFYGRGHESRSLLNLVLAEDLVVLFAKSGMGKSSLINAGLAEPLRKRKYLPIVVRLNDQIHSPMESLLAGVHSAAEAAHVDVLNPDAASAWQLFKKAEFWSEKNELLRPVIILDQFEEIFTLHSPAVRQEFIGQLAELVRGRSQLRGSMAEATTGAGFLDAASPPQLKIVIALREDFLANLEELAREIPAILHNRFRLGPLNRDTAREAIVKPADLTDDVFRTNRFAYQEEAVQRMIAFLSKRRLGAKTVESNEIEPVQLQLICVYLEEMVRQKQVAAKKSNEIIISEADLGGEEQMKQVMEGFYDRTIAALTPHHKARAVQHLCEKRLVSSGGRRLTEDKEEIKRRFKLSDKILRQLVDARLLRAESRLGGTFYEVSHDRLVEPILKSRKRRLVKRRWLAAATVPLLLTFLISSVSLLISHQERKAKREHYRLGTFNPNSESAIRSLVSLVEGRYQYDPQELLAEIESTTVLNPATLVLLVMQDRGGLDLDRYQYRSRKDPDSSMTWALTDKQRSSILKHIKNHRDVFLGLENTAGVPTLLGALLFILQDFEESFRDRDKKSDVIKIKQKLLDEYKSTYCGQVPITVGDNLTADASGAGAPAFVTNRQYQKFFRPHQIPSEEGAANEAVKVNWFEAFAYATCTGQQLPSQEAVKRRAKDVAVNYRGMLDEHRELSFWRQGWGVFLKRLIDKNRPLRIYIP